jgi:hypothetical protein
VPAGAAASPAVASNSAPDASATAAVDGAAATKLADEFIKKNKPQWGQAEKAIFDGSKYHVQYPTPPNEQDMLGPRTVLVAPSGEVREFKARR